MKNIVIGITTLVVLLLSACGAALAPRESSPEFGPVAENFDDSRYIQVCTQTRDDVVYHVDPELCSHADGTPHSWAWYPYGVYLPLYNEPLTSVPGKQTSQPAGKPVTRYSPSIYKPQTQQAQPNRQQAPAPAQVAPVAPPRQPQVQQPAPAQPRVQQPAPVAPARPAPVVPPRRP